MRWLVVCLVVSGCWEEQRVDDSFSETEWEYLQTFRLDHLEPIACTLGARCDDIARFGKQLFFDPRYSGDGSTKGTDVCKPEKINAGGKVACTACHDPQGYFVDTRSDNASSLGVGWTKRNVPGLVDLGHRQSFIWNGKYASVDAVLELALSSPAALASDPCKLVEHVRTTYGSIYGALFTGTSADDIYKNAAIAIGAYEAKLVSGPSPLDRYLAGEGTIGDAAKRGAKLFIGKALCSECHDGPLFADDQFHATGVEQRGLHAPPTDVGRIEVSGDPRDAGRFRTPTLRHIAKTAPYMHAGQHRTLHDVVEFYRWGGDLTGFAGEKDPRIVPLPLTDDDVDDLVAFLETLTGAPVDPKWTTTPELP